MTRDELWGELQELVYDDCKTEIMALIDGYTFEQILKAFELGRKYPGTQPPASGGLDVAF